MAELIVVENLAQIQRSLKTINPEIQKALQVGLLKAAEPVKRDADRLSLTGLSGMKRAKDTPPPWSEQKLGQTTTEVYIVPTQRGKRFSRTAGDRKRAVKFVNLMYGRSYNPALERNQVQVRETVDYAIGTVVRTL